MPDKRFQSGREVMSEYISDYGSTDVHSGDQFIGQDLVLSGRQLGENLVADMEKLLLQLNVRVQSDNEV